jgi:hypothetical protein
MYYLMCVRSHYGVWTTEISNLALYYCSANSEAGYEVRVHSTVLVGHFDS